MRNTETLIHGCAGLSALAIAVSLPRLRDDMMLALRVGVLERLWLLSTTC
jgi:hypothetical protein